ncbi:MAG: hypothetical protein NW223_22030 [Hyphomicrobiaceae bacterium]|nr:hypothetical protein [Hyphomicrobiaceae bacterium]
MSAIVRVRTGSRPMRLLSPTVALALVVVLVAVLPARPGLAQALPAPATEPEGHEVGAPDFRSQGERPLAVLRRQAPAEAPAALGSANSPAKPAMAEQPAATGPTRVLGFIAIGIADAASAQTVATAEPALRRKPAASPTKMRRRPPARVIACDFDAALNRLHRYLRQSL